MLCTSVAKISKTSPEKDKEEKLNPISWEAGNGEKPYAFNNKKNQGRKKTNQPTVLPNSGNNLLKGI